MPPLLSLAALLALPAAEPEKLPRRELGDLAIQARATLARHCGECHNQKAGNPSRLDVLDFAKVSSPSHPVAFAQADKGRSQILEFVEAGVMPPGGRAGPGPDEIAVLRRWMDQPAPLADYPRAFDDRTTLETMLRDFEALPDADKPSARYLSLAHLVPADGAPGRLAEAEARFHRSIGAAVAAVDLTRRAPKVEMIGATATLFRLDLRKLGWDAPDLFEKVEKLSGKGAVEVVPFDLVLLECPDLPAVPTDLEARTRKFYDATGQTRGVPYLRADWFAAAVAGTEPKASATPLAKELASLVALAEATATKGKLPDGPPFTAAQVRFAGRAAAATPPPGSIYAGNPEPAAKPFEFAAAAIQGKRRTEPGKEDLAPAKKTIDSVYNPIEYVPTNEAFRLCLHSEAVDGSFHLMVVLCDGSVQEVETFGNRRFQAGELHVVSPKLTPDFRVASIPTGLPDGYQHFVVLASRKDTKPPVVVRSRHPERPVWRFLPDESEPTVRRIVTLHVAAPSDKK